MEKFFLFAIAVMLGAMMPVVACAEEFETGPNVSGESSASERTQVVKDQEVIQDQDIRIEVPKGPDGMPLKPVRGLSQTEKMEMDDLEHRYQQGQISDAEYYRRRNAMMERVGLEPEY